MFHLGDMVETEDGRGVVLGIVERTGYVEGLEIGREFSSEISLRPGAVLIALFDNDDIPFGYLGCWLQSDIEGIKIEVSHE